MLKTQMGKGSDHVVAGFVCDSAHMFSNKIECKAYAEDKGIVSRKFNAIVKRPIGTAVEMAVAYPVAPALQPCYLLRRQVVGWSS